MSDRPLVSIIVPSFNQGRFIRETLDSILTQDYRPIEVLVMDGGSKDETVEVLKSYDAPELQWVSERDRGVVDGVNKGLARARGDIIAIQSSDDVYASAAIRTAVEALSDADLVFGDVEYIDAESRVTGRSEIAPFTLSDYLAKRMYIPQPAAFFRASAARAAGPWREEVSYAADADFYLRVAINGRVKKISAVLARYRHHEAQRDKDAVRVPRDWARVAEPWTRDSRTRRAAKSGIWMVRHQYLPRRQWLRRSWYLYRMIVADPARIHDPYVRSQRELIPGRYLLWRVATGIRRLLRPQNRSK